MLILPSHSFSTKKAIQAKNSDTDHYLLKKSNPNHWKSRCLLYGILYKNIDKKDIHKSYEYIRLAEEKRIKISSRRHYLFAIELSMIFFDNELYQYLTEYPEYTKLSDSLQAKFADLVFSEKIENVSKSHNENEIIAESVSIDTMRYIYAKSLDLTNQNHSAAEQYQKILNKVGSNFPRFHEIHERCSFLLNNFDKKC